MPHLTCAPDPLLPHTPSHDAVGGRTRRLDPREALRFLNQSKTPKQVKQVHAQILRRGLAHHPTLLAKLIRLYSDHRYLDIASRVFSQITDPPILAWNLMIRAYALTGAASRDALLLYNCMIARGVPPDKFTFPFVTTACSRCADVRKGKEVHASAIKAGFYRDPYVQNALIHLYFTCGDTVSGRQVFDRMGVRSVVSWTALVSGLVTCGELDAARAVFEIMPVRNVVTWTAMIDGYARNGRPEGAFQLFRIMQEDVVRPNEFTTVGLLIACTELGSLSLGRWVHDFARNNAGLDRGVYVGTALIDMYSKCGSLEDAVRVFDEMPVRSLATWNSMITSLGVHGRGREAIALFRETERDNMKPDRITFVGLLCACATPDMVEEGVRLYTYMRKRYGIAAGSEHCRCLVELFRCADKLEEVREMVKILAMEDDLGSQRKLLEACRGYGDIELEKIVSSCIQEIGHQRVVNVCMELKMESMSGKWDDVLASEKLIAVSKGLLFRCRNPEWSSSPLTGAFGAGRPIPASGSWRATHRGRETTPRRHTRQLMQLAIPTSRSFEAFHI